MIWIILLLIYFATYVDTFRRLLWHYARGLAGKNVYKEPKTIKPSHWFWAAIFAVPSSLAGPVLTPIFIGIENQGVFNVLSHAAKAPKEYRQAEKRRIEKLKKEEMKRLAKEREQELIRQAERIKQLEWENGILEKVNTARLGV